MTEEGRKEEQKGEREEGSKRSHMERMERQKRYWKRDERK